MDIFPAKEDILATSKATFHPEFCNQIFTRFFFWGGGTVRVLVISLPFAPFPTFLEYIGRIETPVGSI